MKARWHTIAAGAAGPLAVPAGRPEVRAPPHGRDAGPVLLRQLDRPVDARQAGHLPEGVVGVQRPDGRSGPLPVEDGRRPNQLPAEAPSEVPGAQAFPCPLGSALGG